MPSALEEQFLALWKRTDPNFEELEREVAFDSKRRWRFDFAHRHARVAVEIEGGLHTNRRAKVRGESMLIVGGRHNSAEGFKADCEKYASAAFQGWAVIRLSGDHITPETALNIQRFIRHRLGIITDAPAVGIFRKKKPSRRWTQADVAKVVARAKRVSR